MVTQIHLLSCKIKTKSEREMADERYGDGGDELVVVA